MANSDEQTDVKETISSEIQKQISSTIDENKLFLRTYEILSANDKIRIDSERNFINKTGSLLRFFLVSLSIILTLVGSIATFLGYSSYSSLNNRIEDSVKDLDTFKVATKKELFDQISSATIKSAQVIPKYSETENIIYATPSVTFENAIWRSQLRIEYRVKVEDNGVGRFLGVESSMSENLAVIFSRYGESKPGSRHDVKFFSTPFPINNQDNATLSVVSQTPTISSFTSRATKESCEYAFKILRSLQESDEYEISMRPIMERVEVLPQMKTFRLKINKFSNSQKKCVKKES